MENDNYSNRKMTWLLIALQVGIILISLALGYFAHQFITLYRGEFGLLRQAKDIFIDNTIFDLPSDQELEYGMIQGMLATVNDPFTYFVEPAISEVQSDALAGQYAGIGVRLERDLDKNWRLYPFPDSPAEAAGIQDGDLLLRVDELVVSADTDEVSLVAALRGPEKEAVNITIGRGGETQTLSIDRQSVPLPTVTWNPLIETPLIGILQVNLIAETTAEEIVKGIKDLETQGVRAFILDLRNNGGGLVEPGVEIARLFLDSGEVIHRQIKNQQPDTFRVEELGPFADIPLVVLVNGNTASAAEIVAGALQAQQRSPIVGSPTFGKSTIQYIFDLQDGSTIHITSGRWWITGQSVPLQPDYAVAEDPSGLMARQQAVDLLRDYLD